MKQIGANKFQLDYNKNDGGLNNSDSPFVASPTQAGPNSRNYDYDRTGAFKKRLGLEVVNASANSELRTLGLAARITKDNSKALIRTAARKIQSVATDTGTVTDLTLDDTGATSDFWAASTTAPTNSSMFTKPDSDVLWLAGGGASSIYGVYSSTKVTANGVPNATGSLGLSAAGSGSTLSAGKYYYAVVLEKAATDAAGNAALDAAVTATSGQEVTLDLTTVVVPDTTTYDNLLIYRSSVNGSGSFTAGALVARVASTATSYVDDGTDLSSSVVVPRAGNTLLDQSPLPAGTPLFTTVFKQRLVTTIGNTIYISDTNKPESWPLVNYIDLPTGGEVTGLGVISFVTTSASTIDEILVVFKADEMHIIQGTGSLSSGIADWSLKFLDTTGCASHNSIVQANGYLSWINDRGVFLWDGTNKPIYCSRLIEEYFGFDGSLSKSDLPMCWGNFYKKQNTIIWALSSSTYGIQKVFFKLDLRLTLPRVSSDLSTRVMDGVFITDTYSQSLYGGVSFKPVGAAEEQLFVADDAGFVYSAYKVPNDNAAGIPFAYETQYLDQGDPNLDKVYDQVIAWVEDLGAVNLTLRYWSDYRTGEQDASSSSVLVSSVPARTVALWDVAYWDVAFWDDTSIKLKPVVFNLKSAKNNTQGRCIKLRFEQLDADAPMTIFGWSVTFSPKTYKGTR